MVRQATPGHPDELLPFARPAYPCGIVSMRASAAYETGRGAIDSGHSRRDEVRAGRRQALVVTDGLHGGAERSSAASRAVIDNKTAHRRLSHGAPAHACAPDHLPSIVQSTRVPRSLSPRDGDTFGLNTSCWSTVGPHACLYAWHTTSTPIDLASNARILLRTAQIAFTCVGFAQGSTDRRVIKSPRFQGQRPSSPRLMA